MVDKDFFIQYQRQLVWFANTKIGRWYFDINKHTLKKIEKISPSSIAVLDNLIIKNGKLESTYTETFFCGDEFALKINKLFSWLPFYAYKRIQLDNKWMLRPVLGLTVTDFYPSSSVATMNVVGQVYGFGSGVSWSTIWGAAGNEVDSPQYPSSSYLYIHADSGSNNFREIKRGIHLFDTTTLPSGATITAATFGIRTSGKSNDFSTDPSVCVVSSAPASNSTISAGDYDSLGNTSFGSQAFSNFGTSGAYYYITLSNFTGITNAGITKLGLKYSWDLSGTFGGTWGANKGVELDYYLSTTPPKLTVTYSTSQAYTKDLTDSVSLSEVISKGWAGTKSDAVSLSESLQKAWAGIKSEAVSLSEDFSKSYGFVRSLVDSISLSESVKKDYAATKSDVITLAETIQKAWASVKSDIISLAESFTASRGQSLSLSDSISISESVKKDTAIGKTEGISLTEGVRKAYEAIKSDSITLAETFGRIVGYVREFIENIGLTESLNKGVEISRSDSITFSESLDKIKGYVREFIDSISLTESLKKAVSVVKSEALILSENLLKTMGFFRTFTDSFSLSDSVKKSVGLVKSETITLTESIKKSFAIIKSDSLTLTEIFKRYKNGVEQIWNSIKRTISTDWTSKPRTTSTNWTKRKKPWQP